MTRARSLLFRLMAAFALVIFVTVAIIFVIANQTTTNEFRSYMFRGGMSQSDQVANELAAYYAARGSWQGVDAFLGPALPSGISQMMGAPGRGRGGIGMMGGAATLSVADANGVIVAASDGSVIGQRAASARLAAGTPIQLNGQTVGTLLDQSPVVSAFDATQQDFLQRVNASILFAGLAAGLIALGIGFVLFRQVTAPLNALAAASRQIAAGDLNARVSKTGADEMGQVGSAFNAMADSLSKSEAARRNMIADIAHELRNPLGVIQGQLEGMIDGVFPTTPEQIAASHAETRLLARLVDDLRDLALADAGQLQIARQPTDLCALIEKTVAAFAPQAAEKSIALRTEITAMPPVNLDAQRIEQVLRNLIGNALRHTRENGVISVQCSVSSEQSSVQVRVVDSGAGILREDLPYVFERFWRGDDASSRGDR